MPLDPGFRGGERREQDRIGAGMSEFRAEVIAAPEPISGLIERVMAFLDEAQVDARATHHVALIVEEFLTNLGTHGNCRETPARITIAVEPHHVCGEIVDAGTPFDPRQAPAPALDVAAEDRPEGGLGLFLVRQLSATLDYARRDGENRTRFTVARG